MRLHKSVSVASSHSVHVGISTQRGGALVMHVEMATMSMFGLITTEVETTLTSADQNRHRRSHCHRHQLQMSIHSTADYKEDRQTITSTTG